MVNRVNINKRTLGMIMMMLWVNLAHAAADTWQMNLYRGVTPISKDMYDLHMLAIAICGVIGMIVFGVMFYALIRHRKSRNYPPAIFRDNMRLEIVWTIIPVFILAGLAFPATKILIRMNDNSNSDVTIKIVGHQWRWQYEYLNQGIKYFSNLSTPWDQIQNKQPKNEWYLLEVDKPLVVPIDKKIRFLVTSNDVVHSWWVPELGVKRDAIPGFMHEAWARIEKPGIYRGQCAELCGINHGFMPIVVHAVPQEEFDQWVNTQPKVPETYPQKPSTLNTETTAQQPTFSKSELMEEGRNKYHMFCAACHKANGKGLPPVYPALQSSSVAVGKPIERHIDIILNGVPGTAMQPYRSQLSDEEIAAIATYERNAWGNDTGDVIQPADVHNVRNSQMKAPKMVNKAKAGGFR